MELGRRNLCDHFLKSPKGDIQSLVSLESAWKHDHHFTVGPSARHWPKDVAIDIVDKHRAFAIGAGALRVFITPKVVGDDHTVGETS
jgi:hypothetical protein